MDYHLYLIIKSMIDKSVLILFGLLVIIGTVVAWILYSNTPPKTIASYAECIAAGHPVLETFPEQCITPNGDTFTRAIPPGEESVPPPPQEDKINPDQAVFCTMEALECPDGSFVGRIPPSCEFAPCPGN